MAALFFRFNKAAAALCIVLLLSACAGGDEMVELQDYVQSVVIRPPGRIEPLPEFVSYESFTYSAATLRSPFDVPVDITALIRSQVNNEVKPDENRTKEILENFSLGSLSMLGTLGRGDQTWALVRDESGRVTRITVGNYIGKNHGLITNVFENQIEIREIVPTGNGGWIERPQSLLLEQGAN